MKKMSKFKRDNLNKLIELLRVNHFMKVKELSYILGVTTRTISNYINILKNDGYQIENRKGRNGGVFFIDCKKQKILF